MEINGKEYVMRPQTAIERQGHACEGCDLKDTEYCQRSGRECVQMAGSVYKEAK